MDFRADMARRIESLAPFHVAAMGADALHAFIEDSIARARDLDIVQRDTTRFWLELSVLWGIGFAQDPSYGFAADALAEQLPELQRMRALHRAARCYIERACGTNGEHFRSALTRVEARSQLPFPDDMALDTATVASNLADIWPERAQVVGRTAILSVSEQGSSIAEQLRVSTKSGRLLCAVLAWFLGSSFADDPQYRWLLGTSESANEASGRDYALRRRALAYLRTVLQDA